MRTPRLLIAALLALAPSLALAQGASAPIRLPRGSTGPADGLTIGGTAIPAILGSKAPLASPTFTGTVTAAAMNVPGPVAAGSLSGNGSGIQVYPGSGSPTVGIPLSDLSGCISPVSWGMSPSNTAAVNASAMNTAIAQAVSAGKPVCVRTPGVYNFRFYQISTDNVRIYSDPGVVYKVPNGGNERLFYITASRVVIDGGEFDGNRANNSIDGPGLIDVDAASKSGFTLVNAYIHDTPAYGVRTIISNPRVQNNRFANTRDTAIYAPAQTASISDAIISGNLIDNPSGTGATSGRMGIQVHAISGNWTRVVVQGNTINMPLNVALESMGIELLGFNDNTARIITATVTGNVVTGGGQGISIGRATNATVTANAVSGQSFVGIEIPESNRGVVASNNTIDLRGTAAGPGVLIACQASCGEAVAVSGNIIYSGAPTQHGIHSQAQAGKPNSASITNNRIYMTSTATTTFGNGIYLQNSGNTIASGNYIEGPSCQGIDVNKPYNVAVNDNMIIGSRCNGILLNASTAGTYFFSANNNMISPVAGATIGRDLASGSVTTGSVIRGNTSPAGVVADWVSP